MDADGSGGVWRPHGINVLSETMKFGKLLNRVRNDGRVYLNYKELKQCLAESVLFKEKLKREIRYVDTFFKRSEKEVVLNKSLENVVGLRRFVVINVFAVLKIVQKHDKWHPPERSCRAEMISHLQATAFYNAMVLSEAFNPVHPTTPEPCTKCHGPMESPCILSSCPHRICWNCLMKMEETHSKVCMACNEPITLSVSTLLAEDILGVEPRVTPRRERRRRGKGGKGAPPAAGGKGGDRGEHSAQDILAESDDDKEEKAAQRSVRYYCKDCSMVLNSFRQAHIHTNGQRHIDQVQRLKDRYQREGIEYESVGLVVYDGDVKVEGAPKPRRSRGGVKNRLQQQAQQAQQVHQAHQVHQQIQHSHHQMHHPSMHSAHMSGVPLPPPSDMPAEDCQTIECHHNPYSAGPLGLRDFMSMGMQPVLYNNFPGPFVSHEAHHLPIFPPSEVSEPQTPHSTLAYPTHQTHSFQVERNNSAMRQDIEKVITGKDTADRASLKALQSVLSEPNGSVSLVEEIFRGIFNGENTMDYANVCKMLVESADPEMSLAYHEFTHHLLQKCRVTVTTIIETASITYDMPQEQIDALEEHELRERFRRNSAIKFSADLYSQGIMPEALVHVCVQTMLFGKTVSLNACDEDLGAMIDEDNVATACRILSTVGIKMKAKSMGFIQKYCDVLNKALKTIGSTRIKRKVKAVLEQLQTPEEEPPKEVEQPPPPPPKPIVDTMGGGQKLEKQTAPSTPPPPASFSYLNVPYMAYLPTTPPSYQISAPEECLAVCLP